MDQNNNLNILDKLYFILYKFNLNNKHCENPFSYAIFQFTAIIILISLIILLALPLLGIMKFPTELVYKIGFLIYFIIIYFFVKNRYSQDKYRPIFNLPKEAFNKKINNNQFLGLVFLVALIIVTVILAQLNYLYK
jgi:Ca2+/Na+ antiporter